MAGMRAARGLDGLNDARAVLHVVGPAVLLFCGTQTDRGRATRDLDSLGDTRALLLLHGSLSTALSPRSPTITSFAVSTSAAPAGGGPLRMPNVAPSSSPWLSLSPTTTRLAWVEGRPFSSPPRGGGGCRLASPDGWALGELAR
jgi:hypothetical protein